MVETLHTQPLTDVHVDLIGEDGNAFAIMGRVSKALKRAGHKDLADEYFTEATSGDYDHLLQTTMKYVHTDGGSSDAECLICGACIEDGESECYECSRPQT